MNRKDKTTVFKKTVQDILVQTQQSINMTLTGAWGAIQQELVQYAIAMEQPDEMGVRTDDGTNATKRPATADAPVHAQGGVRRTKTVR